MVQLHCREKVRRGWEKFRTPDTLQSCLSHNDHSTMFVTGGRRVSAGQRGGQFNAGKEVTVNPQLLASEV